MFGKRKPKPEKPDILFEVSNDLGDHIVGHLPAQAKANQLARQLKGAGAVPDTDEKLKQLPGPVAKRIVDTRDKAQYRFKIEREWDNTEDLEPEQDSDEILEPNEVPNEY